jgi:hypothetical protein
MPKQITPGREAEGIVCLHARADTDALITVALRHQHLSRFGISSNRAAIIAPLCFGEIAHV